MQAVPALSTHGPGAADGLLPVGTSLTMTLSRDPAKPAHLKFSRQEKALLRGALPDGALMVVQEGGVSGAGEPVFYVQVARRQGAVVAVREGALGQALQAWLLSRHIHFHSAVAGAGASGGLIATTRVPRWVPASPPGLLACGSAGWLGQGRRSRQDVGRTWDWSTRMHMALLGHDPPHASLTQLPPPPLPLPRLHGPMRGPQPRGQHWGRGGGRGQQRGGVGTGGGRGDGRGTPAGLRPVAWLPAPGAQPASQVHTAGALQPALYWPGGRPRGGAEIDNQVGRWRRLRRQEVV